MTETQRKFRIGDWLELNFFPELLLVRIVKFEKFGGVEVVNIWKDMDFYYLDDKNLEDSEWVRRVPRLELPIISKS